MKSYKIVVKGIVQGVGFRAFVKNIADVMNIDGYVKNQEDDTVLVIANLNNENRDNFLKELKIGPPSSKVDSIDSKEIEYFEYDSFDIRH